MINEAKKQFIEKAGPSTQIKLPGELERIGAENPHEETLAQDAVDQLQDTGAQHAGDQIPPSTNHEGIINHHQFEIDNKISPSEAIRWLGEKTRLIRQREELRHAA